MAAADSATRTDPSVDATTTASRPRRRAGATATPAAPAKKAPAVAKKAAAAKPKAAQPAAAESEEAVEPDGTELELEGAPDVADLDEGAVIDPELDTEIAGAELAGAEATDDTDDDDEADDEADDDREWQEYLVLLRSLRWVLTGALLLQAGLDPARLRERLQQHQPYQFLLRQARQWLPDLYPAPSPGEPATDN